MEHARFPEETASESTPLVQQVWHGIGILPNKTHTHTQFEFTGLFHFFFWHKSSNIASFINVQSTCQNWKMCPVNVSITFYDIHFHDSSRINDVGTRLPSIKLCHTVSDVKGTLLINQMLNTVRWANLLQQILPWLSWRWTTRTRTVLPFVWETRRREVSSKHTPAFREQTKNGSHMRWIETAVSPSERGK